MGKKKKRVEASNLINTTSEDEIEVEEAHVDGPSGIMSNLASKQVNPGFTGLDTKHRPVTPMDE